MEMEALGAQQYASIRQVSEKSEKLSKLKKVEETLNIGDGQKQWCTRESNDSFTLNCCF